MSVNRVFLVGRLGHDPSLKHTNNDLPICSFRLATNDRAGKENVTEWHSVVTFGKTAENCAQYLAKGKEVFVEGRLSTSSWEGKDGVKKSKTEIMASSVKFLGSKSESSGGGEYRTDNLFDGPPAAVSFEDDDIPF